MKPRARMIATRSGSPTTDYIVLDLNTGNKNMLLWGKIKYPSYWVGAPVFVLHIFTYRMVIVIVNGHAYSERASAHYDCTTYARLQQPTDVR